MYSLQAYKAINKLPWPKSYSAKFLLISFIGIHIPLLGLIIYLLPQDGMFTQQLPIILVALASTLAGLCVTLWLLAKLLNPISLTSQVLQQYINDGKLPDLPAHYEDEAGKLMANTQEAILHLDELVTVKNDLLSIISHDARSPINSIILAREMIETELQDEPVDKETIQKYLDIIKLSSNNQLELMNNILTLARLDSKDVIVDKEKVSLNDIAARIKETNELQLSTKNISFITDLGELDRQSIYIDEIKILAVLNNLVQNAAKFTPKNGTITFSAAHNKGQIKLSISDNGVGIEESNMDNLFTRDSSSHKKGTQQEKGSGLGLWICKVFTELNNGTISSESTVGEGSTFTLSFDAEDVLQPQGLI